MNPANPAAAGSQLKFHRQKLAITFGGVFLAKTESMLFLWGDYAKAVGHYTRCIY
jgi:hypothetical protein